MEVWVGQENFTGNLPRSASNALEHMLNPANLFIPVVSENAQTISVIFL